MHENNAPTPASTKKPISTFRRIAPIVIIVASTAGVALYQCDQTLQPKLVLGPMVQMHALDRLTVVWTASAEKPTGWIRFTAPSGSTAEQRLIPVDSRYIGELTDLRPGMDYQYEIFNEGALGRRVLLSGPHTYRSAPRRGGGAFRFIAFGDSGIGGNAQTALAELIASQQPHVIIHVGDLIYPAGAARDYPLNFYEPNASFLPSIPIMPCLGNHDVATDRGAPLLEEFILPANGPEGIESERNYYFDYGDARFVALDTNLKKHGGAITHEEMKTVVAQWLRTVLTDCDAKWKFVYFHHPYYTGSAHSADGAAFVKEAFVEVIESCGVDVVFAGHNHLYERTAPILRDEIVPDGEGVVYITTGAGGARRYPETLPPPDYIRHYNDQVLSFTCVDVTSDKLVIRQLDEAGEVIDAYEMHKP